MIQLFGKRGFRAEQQASVPTPPSGHRHLVPKSDGWYDKNAAGTETKLATGTGPTGPTGPTGGTGPTGPTGATGSGVAGVTEIAFGSGNISLSAAATGSAVVTHGMGGTPTAINVTIGGGKTQYFGWVSGVGASQFTAGTTHRGGTTATDTIPFYWIAVR